MDATAKKTATAIVCLALALSLAAPFAAPANAYADFNGKSAQTLTASGLSTQASDMAGRLDADKLSLALTPTSSSVGEAIIIWHLPVLPYCHEFTGKTLTARYYYGKDAKNVEYKTVKFDDDRAGMLLLTGLRKGKTINVQLRLNGKYGGKTYHGPWSSVRSTKVKKVSTSKVKAPSWGKLTSPAKGKAKVTWKAANLKGATLQYYTVRYSYYKDMRSYSVKSTKGTSVALSGLKKGKTVYVQLNTGYRYDDEPINTVHYSDQWSAVKAVKVKG